MKFEIFRNVILDEIKQFNDGKVSFYPEDDTISKLARAWYLGYVPEVHNYKLFNGKKFNTFKKKQLGLYKKSCEDSASMLLNEKCDIVIGDAESQLQFSKLLYNNNFWVKANQGIEVSFALGYGFLVQGVKDLKVTEDGSIINDGKGKYVVDFVNAEKCLPLIVEDDKVTDIAFVKVNTLNTIISIHCKDRRTLRYKTYHIFGKEVQDPLPQRQVLRTFPHLDCPLLCRYTRGKPDMDILAMLGPRPLARHRQER